MMRDPTRQQQQQSTIFPPSVGSARTTPPYSPDLAPSDFNFFPAFKRALEGRRFTTNEDAEAAVRIRDTDFYQQGFFKIVKRWDKCINVGGDYAEK
jgi:histone-lysine N-methyltransferase SETMAR